MTEQTREGPLAAGIKELPTARLGQEFQNLATAVAERALTNLTGRIDGLAGRLTGYVEDGGTGLMEAVTGKSGSGMLSSLAERSGVSGLLSSLTGSEGGGSHPVRSALAAYAKEKVKGIFSRVGGGKGGKSKKLKLTNIVEAVDVGAPLRVVYDQWTQFEQFPSFMKKIEMVNQKSDEKLDWKAQIWWSHRTWEATILEQTPDKLIVWRSQGPKGYVDGAVTFHEVTPDMTRVLLAMEYHPQGMFEHTGNLWRAQGRRARLELKNFRRHVMTQALLHPDEIEGWRGVIHDSEVVKDHETAVREEQEREGREPVERAEEEPYEEEPYEEEAESEEGEPYEEEPYEEEAEGEPYEEEPEAEERRRPSRPVRPRRPMAERPARRRGQERPARERDEADEDEEPEERPLRRRRTPAEQRRASSASLRHGR
ncbi:SRPBCC family protein [Planotetraspora phitsanulokensis]|uniref:SRPBCC family protein n=1 Tax=Planotetraspora phitsanulokensis TaxID=575192 RepID=UPI001EF18222|nr:SRPBCC family protein [Planotetraspora phitsanulokensis]